MKEPVWVQKFAMCLLLRTATNKPGSTDHNIIPCNMFWAPAAVLIIILVEIHTVYTVYRTTSSPQSTQRLCSSSSRARHKSSVDSIGSRTWRVWVQFLGEAEVGSLHLGLGGRGRETEEGIVGPGGGLVSGHEVIWS